MLPAIKKNEVVFMHLPSVRYQDLFRFRSVWMGFAILWVTVFHSSLNWSQIKWFQTFGYGGVDIFFFASGLGCYYSLKKQPDPLIFFAKRVRRILPTYYAVLVVWLALQIFVFRSGITALEILGNLFCTGTFTSADHQFNWYVSAVWVSYLLAPLFALYLDCSRRFRLFLPVLLLLAISTTFLGSEWSLMLFATRLPIFYVGMLFAKCAQQQETIRWRTLAGSLLVSVAGFALLLLCYIRFPFTVIEWGMFWYPFLLITPGLCIALSLLCMLLQRVVRWPISLLATLGSASFEMYMIHLTLFDGITYLREQDIYQPNNTFWCAAILLCCVLAVLLHKLIAWVESRFARPVTV